MTISNGYATSGSFYQVTLGIDGMTCSSCSSAIETHLNSLNGVQSAEVVLATSTSIVDFNGELIDVASLIDEVECIGFGADVLVSPKLMQHVEDHAASTQLSKSTKMYVVQITGSGAKSVKADVLRMRLLNLDGILEANLLDDKSLTISTDDDIIGPRNIVQLAKSLGVDISLSSQGGFMMAQRMQSQYDTEMKTAVIGGGGIPLITMVCQNCYFSRNFAWNPIVQGKVTFQLSEESSNG